MFPIATRSSIALAASLLMPPFTYSQSARWQQDQQTESKVQQALTSSQFAGSSIQSSVNNGVVKLFGNVRSEQEKEQASESLANISGVKTVMNNLTVVPTMQAAPAKAASVAVGTTLPIRLNGEIDTKTAKAGDTFQGTIAANVLSGATVALPTGTPVTGRIVDAKPAGRLAGAAELSLELVSVQLNGQPVALTTRVLSSKNNGRGTNTAARTGGGAALGAIIGGLAGGGAGAGIGAASGGVLGLGSNIIRPGQQIVLKPESLLQFQTASNLDLGTPPAASGVVSAPVHVRAEAGNIPGQPDPYTFDIVGLKLGMTAQQAAAAVVARVPQATKTPFERGTPQFTPTARFTSGFSVNGPKFTVLLTFVESYPFDPQKPEQLSAVFYTANTPAAADRAQFEQAALTKYGTPASYTKGVAATWCNQGQVVGPNAVVCAPDTPTLVLKANELVLGDNGIAAKERAAWNKQGSGAPPL